MSAIFTGYFGLMLAGFELQSGFCGNDCYGMLDAPEQIAAGSTVRVEWWNGLVGTAFPSSSRAYRY